MIKVTQYNRKPNKFNNSIERLFSDIKLNISKDITIKTYTCRYYSVGIFGRIVDIFTAKYFQGDVNHVTGDVHFLTYFLKKKYTILTIHDCVTLEYSSGLRRLVIWFLWFYLPNKCCNKITVVSNSTKNQLLKIINCDESKIIVIHNNLSSEFTYSPKKFNILNPRILHVGTSQNKNLRRHIESLIGLKCELVVIGNIPDDDYISLVNSGLIFHNYYNLSREDLLLEYKKCDLLLFASTYEGFGLPIIEAQGIGRSVITSNLFSMPEIAGIDACLVNPYDINDIRAAVLKICSDESYRDKLITSGYENSKRFNIFNVANQYSELYKEIFYDKF